MWSGVPPIGENRGVGKVGKISLNILLKILSETPEQLS
jgi:hypothetical protein